MQPRWGGSPTSRGTIYPYDGEWKRKWKITWKLKLNYVGVYRIPGFPKVGVQWGGGGIMRIITDFGDFFIGAPYLGKLLAGPLIRIGFLDVDIRFPLFGETTMCY